MRKEYQIIRGALWVSGSVKLTRSPAGHGEGAYSNSQNKKKGHLPPGSDLNFA